MAATCSTVKGAEYIMRDAVFEPGTNIPVYSCHCKGQARLFVLGPGYMKCVIHYWICPVIS